MINTLQIYKESLSAGFTEEQAVSMANASSLMEKTLREEIYSWKSEFASNRVVTIFGTAIMAMGGLIIGIGGFTLNKVTHIDKRLTVLETKFETLSQHVDKLYAQKLAKLQ